jgi:DNA helicase-2/ATP-dependent DNA helicase PcrA
VSDDTTLRDATGVIAETNPGIKAALGGFDPSVEQRNAIEFPPEPLAIIAGAGSGKTAVMAARIAHFILSGTAKPSQILGLTFTNKAAHELEERVRIATAPLGLDPGDEPSVFTYNSFADRMIRDYGPKIGIEPEVALLSEAQAHMLLAGLLEELTFDVIPVRGLSYLIGRMRGLADQCSNHLLAPESLVEADGELLRRVFEGNLGKVQRDLRKTIEQRPDYCKAVRAYIDRKRQLKRIDYGDQIAFAYRIVTQRPEVALALRERWPVCLLDEYQDTNVAQRRMMEAIYLTGSAITVVGDPDQAIYAWRGATLHNILYFPEHFKNADGSPAQKRPLEVSFRSAKKILQVADAIISRVSSERRGVVDKVLAHHPPTGDGEVTTDVVESDEDEARMIAAEIKSLAGEDGEGLQGKALPFDEVAILCRKRRLFGKILMALRAQGIPVEVVGLSGLLQLPEVIDLLAYLRVAVRPGDNISFARIAMGPRWRIHYGDLAAVARWAARQTRHFQEALEANRADEGEVDPGTERFSLSEASGRIDEIDDLLDEARRRLLALHADIESMRTEIKGRSLTEAVERVLEMSGIEDELIAAGTDAAHAARSNLTSFLDRTSEFAPLEGSATLETFLDFVATAASVEDIEVAQPQMENSVKLMTVHQAKGLEFDLVYIPGMAKEIFPDIKVNQDPTTSPAAVPFWARDDQEFLPRFTGVMKHFHDELKERAEEEERRLAYVAMTRARKALRLSAAHWYGIGNYERKKPNGPGMFLVELAGESATDEHPARPPHEAVTVRLDEACPPENPLQVEWERRARGWPPSDEVGDDPLFVSGWRRAAEDARERPSVIDDAVSSSGIDPGDFESARHEVARQLDLVTSPPPSPKPDERLKSLSVSSIVQLARCPKQFYWTVVRPLPRRPSAAARLGHEIHRWIEIQSIGQQRLDDPEAPPDLTPEERGTATAAELPAEEQLKHNFESSRYAALHPRYVEQSFAIWLPGDFLVRGRIDAVYVYDDGTWEVVDYKTGREPDLDDETAKMQLSIYAIAARQIWGIDAAQLKVTYFYLKSGAIRSTPATELKLDEAELVEAFKVVDGRIFDPTPGSLCHWCDFLEFCKAGQAHVAATPRTTV